MIPPTEQTGSAPVCSARGCRAPAVWALRWRNPRRHPPERRKTWLACEEHRGHLSEFLSVRGFLCEVETVDAVTGTPVTAPATEEAGA